MISNVQQSMFTSDILTNLQDTLLNTLKCADGVIFKKIGTLSGRLQSKFERAWKSLFNSVKNLVDVLHRFDFLSRLPWWMIVRRVSRFWIWDVSTGTQEVEAGVRPANHMRLIVAKIECAWHVVQIIIPIQIWLYLCPYKGACIGVDEKWTIRKGLPCRK